MRYFLGLDVAKASFHAALLDEQGKLLQQAQFNNCAEGFAELLAWLPGPAETLAVCEPTGAYGKRLVRALSGAVGSMHEINAQSLRQFQFSQVRTKTDPADALNIAQAARTLYLSKPQTLQNTRVSCSAARDNLTLWISEYDRLRKEIASLRNQIRILDHEPASEVSRVRALRQDHLRDLQERQAEVTREIERVYALLDDRQAQLLHSIPGIGRLTTATALVVIRDLSRFASAEALKAYLGTYPVRRQSGAHESPAHLARHGNQLMRHMLWNAARAAVRHKHPQNPFRLLFDRLTAKHKSYPCAIGAVVRKLVQTIYGVLKTQTAFHFPNPTP